MANLLIGIVLAVTVNSLELGGSNKSSFWSYYEAVGDFIKTNPVATYAKESLEDLHEYLVEEDVYGKAYRLANDVKDYTADSVKKLKKHGESLSSELKDVAKEYYQEAKTSAKELYKISKDSAYKFTDYAQKSASEFKEYASQSIHDIQETVVNSDIYINSLKSANRFTKFAQDHTKNSASQFKEYVSKTIHTVKESDYYKNPQKSTYEFIEYLKSNPYALNQVPLKYLVNIVQSYTTGETSKEASRIFSSLMKENFDINLNILPIRYLSQTINNISKSGVYSGSKEVLKIASRALSYWLEVISIDRLSDVLVDINGDDEFYGVNNINPFDVLIPSLCLALSAYTFGISTTLTYQLVSEVVSSILLPQPKPSLEICDYRDHIIHHLLYYEKSHCLPKLPHKSSKSTRCSDYLKRVSYRFYRVYKDVSKHNYYQLPLDLVDSILDSDAYYSECF